MASLFPLVRWGGALLFVFLMTPLGWPVLPSATGATTKTAPAPATLQVSGYGLLGNRKLKQMLTTVLLDQKRPAFFEPLVLEDAAFLLFSQVRQDGFLRPRIVVRVTAETGRLETFSFEEPEEIFVPPGLRASGVEFQVEKGVRYHFQRIEFRGLQTLKADRARSFFVETGVLPLDRYRVYTPRILERGLNSLVESLRRQGYAQAAATVASLRQDDRTGHVSAVIQVDQGPWFVVRSVREEVREAGTNAPPQVRVVHPNTAYSKVWEQNYAQALRTNWYHRGYPDATVALTLSSREETNGMMNVHSLAQVQTGPRVKVKEIRFVGSERTRETVMARRVALKEGEWLDRMEAERGRLRLSRLGVFNSVEMELQPPEGDSRDVVYKVREGKRIDLSLLFGLGSYELLRGGFDLRQHNLFGRAHQSHLRAVQSFKSSRGLYTYTMPEILGENWDVFVRGSAFRREEVSFTRVEYGGGAGMERYFRRLDSTVALRYDYQILDATGLPDDVTEEGVANPAVGAFVFDLRHDQRDHPLVPRRGYKVFANLELGSELLLGDVDYQRLEFFGSFHHPLDSGRWIHLGLSHGLAASIGSPGEDLPFARRFFPGGENSIRGFQEGEASPRNEQGEFVGAESYVLGTVEFEQALTPSLSLVLFSDSLGMARRLSDYPGHDLLFSLGGGVRWKTVVGPVRVEYGHNLNPRRHDPSGTIHFSLGFPF